MQIKELSVNNKEIIKQFFTGVFTKKPWNDDWSDEVQLDKYIIDLIGNANSLSLGFYDGEELVALSLGHIKHWYSGTEYYIDELCVKTDRQGRGIGTEFVRQLEKLVVSKGITNLYLLTNKNVPAYEFYKKNNFIECEYGTVAFAKELK